MSVVTAEVANFVAELNSIFEQLEFADGTKGYGFAIAKIIVSPQQFVLLRFWNELKRGE